MVALAIPALVAACGSMNNRAAVAEHLSPAANSGPATEYSGTVTGPRVARRTQDGGSTSANRTLSTPSRVSFSSYSGNSYPGNGSYICSPSGFGKQSSCFLR